jgi:hypothetical protein
MKHYSLLASLLAACAAEDLSTNGPLTVTLAQATVPLGTTVRAIVSNRSNVPVTTPVNTCSTPGPYEKLSGSSWVERFGPDTLACGGFVYTDTVTQAKSLNYSWAAPSDTGTYRLNMSVGGYALISRTFVVR